MKPTIAVGRVVWRWPTPRRLFVWWQRQINGFELVEKLRGGGRALVFRCTHYNLDDRTCDSYDSRPFMCRTYPRVLLDQTWPELFDDCSYTLVDRLGAGLSRALDDVVLSDEAREALKRRLRLPGSAPTVGAADDDGPQVSDTAHGGKRAP
ncbi:MAG: hypothetical protein CL927_12720 [Deltaproteobacteria bacterium]|nr:hypothetical protein [Deltaproteobacteria bacterium]